MINEKTAFVLAALVVAVSFVAPSISGFTVASECSGTPILQLTPNPAQASQPITASITGLKNCYGAQVLLKEDICSGPTIASFGCKGVNCHGDAVFAMNSAKDYLITACIDRDNNGDFLGSNERAPTVLQVISLPDLSADKILLLPEAPAAGQPIAATATISNLGVTAATGFTYRYEIFRQNWPTAFYSYSNEVGDFPSKTDAALEASESKQVQLPSVSLSSGTYRIKLSLDYGNRFVESNEMNNIYETTLVVV